jgi:hypothetical protein
VSSPVNIAKTSGGKYFYLEPYLSGVEVGPFICPIEEYNQYLEKDGFIINNEFFNKNRKTISMRKDIYLEAV